MAGFRVVKTDAEWKRILPTFTYQVLRQAATERPYSSPLNNEHRTGIFRCAGCNWPLYSSKDKFESGTAWAFSGRTKDGQPVPLSNLSLEE